MGAPIRGADIRDVMWPEDPARVRPMLASIGEVSLVDAGVAYEPKYDGIRAIVAIEPDVSDRARRSTPARVRIWSRLGNEKAAQFPEIASALGAAFAGTESALLVDGEIVALDGKGQPTSFLHLQSRIHLRGRSQQPADTSVAFIAFDLLIEGSADRRPQPLRARRARLERLFADRTNQIVRLSEQVVGDGLALQTRAHEGGWEGLIAKRVESRYVSDKRSTDWYKVKLVRHQTCVIGGWTDPRNTRHRFGALVLGVYDDEGGLRHIGQAGTGFSDAELERVWKRLQSAVAKAPPFIAVPRALQGSHWVTPTLACEVKFTEWTLDGKLRHPTYLGMRDDVEPRSIKKEPEGGVAPRARAVASPPKRTSRPAAGKTPTLGERT